MSRGNNSPTVCVNGDDSDKWMLIVVGKSLKLYCFKDTKKGLCVTVHR